jgi:hypothetical protein
MPQSSAEAESLMEQQHGFNTSQGNFHEDTDDDEPPWPEHIADLCANCAHMRESHVDYHEDCCEADCDCLQFKEPE